MEMRMAIFALFALWLCGCTCTLASCAVDEDVDVEAIWGERYTVEREVAHGGPLELDYMAVETITDTETGQQWVAVITTHGVDMEPITYPTRVLMSDDEGV